jgi:hypothetical protein
MKIAKYEFDSQAQAESKIEALGVATDEDGNIYPTHKHSIVKLGNITLQQGVFDEDGNEVTPPVLSDKYHVDVLWNLSDDTYDDEGNVVYADHPYGWKTYSVDLDDNGVHSFMGLDYTKHKFIQD